MSTQVELYYQEQAAQIANVSIDLSTINVQNQARFNTLQNEINALEEKTLSLDEDVDRLESKIDTTITELNSLKDELQTITTHISQVTIDSADIYQKVKPAIVRISNGEGIVGTGFIFNSKPYILTAYHVAANLDALFVIFPDGTVSSARIVGSSQYSDIAILAPSNKTPIETLVFTDSAKVFIGEPVVTIGNPLGETETITSGIVSQIDRFREIEFDGETRFVANLIQFDAPANSGSSGGPLINKRGEILGMVIARVNPDTGDGIYYAVSSNKLNRVVSSILADGSFDYPWLGLIVNDITPEIAQTRKLETTNGVLVENVLANSNATSSDIQKNDIIIESDGIKIRDVAHLASYLGEYKSANDRVVLRVIRNSETIEISLRLDTRTGSSYKFSL